MNHQMIETRNELWGNCFEQYNTLQEPTKLFLRSIAIKSLNYRWPEHEIGTSDVNMELYNMWFENDLNWNQTLSETFRNFEYL